MDKVDFKSIKFTIDKEGHYILIKGSVEQEDITIINICAPNDRLSKYMKQKWAEFEGRNREFYNNRDFNASLPINQLDPTRIYRTFHPMTTAYTFFSSAHGTC